MKILKRPENLIFDTENPDKIEISKLLSAKELSALHHVTDQTDWEFLSEYFRPESQIFNDFGNSYFYKL